jgi:2',3'-cyclic-nucleotide 2'-phosphodiesterase
MRVLFIGDIVGSPGRQIVRERLADLVEHQHIDLVIANGENSASGFGITPRIAQELFQYGIEVITGGNHSWDRKEIFDFIPHEPRLLRPANFAEGNPGSGLYVGTAKNGVKCAVLNLQGRVFLPANDDPFKKADSELGKLPDDVAFVLVDIHAETTSEDRLWLVSGWASDRSGGYAYPRGHCRRAGLPGGHSVHHGRRDDRATRGNHRHGARSDHQKIYRWTADAV